MPGKNIPDGIKQDFHLLARQVVQLHGDLQNYKQVFAAENLPLLNETLPDFFKGLQGTYLTSIFLNLVRLTGREEDLTLARILKLCGRHCSGAFLTDQKRKLAAIVKEVEPIKKIRNKVLGHNDPKHLANHDLLPKVTREQIERAADAIAEWMNDISLELTDQRDEYDFHHPVTVGDGRGLLHYIHRASEAFDEDERKRMGRT